MGLKRSTVEWHNQFTVFFYNFREYYLICMGLWEISIARQNGGRIKCCATLLTVKRKTAVTFSGQCTSTSIASPDRSLHITSRKLTKVTGGILLTHCNSGFSILFRSVAPARIFSCYAIFQRPLSWRQKINTWIFKNCHRSKGRFDFKVKYLLTHNSHVLVTSIRVFSRWYLPLLHQNHSAISSSLKSLYKC